jgi:glutathione S-transferase
MDDLQTLWADPDISVTLRSTVTSPFGRKVRVAARVLGLENRITRQDADTRDPDDSLRRQNPLGKMPCLLIGEEAFYDSAVILDLMDKLAGSDRLMPVGGLARFRCLTRARLADGIADAALLLVYEGRFRGHRTPAAPWLAHQRDKVLRTLEVFEVDPPDAARPDLVAITLACALGYLDWRQPVIWRLDHPRLAAWLTEFTTRCPAFADTETTTA